MMKVHWLPSVPLHIGFELTLIAAEIHQVANIYGFNQY